MKENQTESYKKCLLVKIYEWHKTSHPNLIKKRSTAVWQKRMRARPQNTKSFYHDLTQNAINGIYLYLLLLSKLIKNICYFQFYRLLIEILKFYRRLTRFSPMFHFYTPW